MVRRGEDRGSAACRPAERQRYVFAEREATHPAFGLVPGRNPDESGPEAEPRGSGNAKGEVRVPRL